MIRTVKRERGATPRVMLREQNRIARETAEEVGLYWHERFLPKHFTLAGAREYGYAPRDGEKLNPGAKGFRRSYTGRKLRTKGHTHPLEYSGTSRRLLSVPRLRVTATKGVAVLKILLNAPAFNFKNPHSDADMRKEITAVSAPEETAMTEVVARGFQKRYAALQS